MLKNSPLALSDMIMNLYSFIDCSEQATVKLTYRSKYLQEKLARYSNHLIFMMHCKDQNIIPKGLRMRLSVNSKKASHITWRVAKTLLREHIKEARQQKLHLE